MLMPTLIGGSNLERSLVWDSITNHITAKHSGAAPGSFTIVSGRVVRKERGFPYFILYKLVLDNEQPDNSYVLVFDDFVKKPIEGWKVDRASCAHYGYSEYESLVRCVTGDQFKHYLNEEPNAMISI